MLYSPLSTFSHSLGSSSSTCESISIAFNPALFICSTSGQCRYIGSVPSHASPHTLNLTCSSCQPDISTLSASGTTCSSIKYTNGQITSTIALGRDCVID